MDSDLALILASQTERGMGGREVAYLRVLNPTNAEKPHQKVESMHKKIADQSALWTGETKKTQHFTGKKARKATKTTWRRFALRPKMAK